MAAPVALVHWPVQQSVERLQTSPAWMQYEAPSAHVPFLQNDEQHSVPAAHGFPEVLQEALSGWQAPLVHTPLQQAAAD